MNDMHRINLHIHPRLYPLLHNALKGLKPREKAELIRRLAELALILQQENQKPSKAESQSSDDSIHNSSDDEIDNELSKLFDDDLEG